MTDYIIVGCGLAGIAFAETALRNGKSIMVFDNDSQTSSNVAAGIYNPVILKRFSGLANAQQQLDQMSDFYNVLESKLNVQLNFPMPVLRKFTSVEDQNNWFLASDKPALAPFLSTRIITKKFDGIDSPFGFGEVLQTGYVDTAAQLMHYRNFLLSESLLQHEPFDYAMLSVDGGLVHYGNTTARH